MTAVAERALYAISDAMSLLSMSRTVIYEQIRAGRLDTVHHRRCYITAAAIERYVALLESEARPMAARRSRGEGGVHFSESRQRWIATAQLGFQPDGKRIVKTATGQTKTEAKNKLKKLIRDGRHRNSGPP